MSSYSPETARAKWCPFANAAYKRQSGSLCHIGNRTMENETVENPAQPTFKMGIQHACCLADHCMMWRWESKAATMKRQKELDEIKADKDEKVDRHGFCGLGAPVK